MFAKAAGIALLVALAATLVLVRVNSHATTTAADEQFLAGEIATGVSTATVDTAVFAGGCFWGIEAVFEHIIGVESSVSGYSGGSLPAPSYEDVSSGRTGHAEAVRVVYNPSVVSYSALLKVFFLVAHDPTELDRQGPDVGTQYRSAIFFRDDTQKNAATAYVNYLNKTRAFPSEIVTQLAALTKFYPAEEYHQDYLVHHPDSMYIIVNDAPKLVRLKERFPEMYREER